MGHMSFQIGIRTLSRIELEAIHITYWQKKLSTFCLYPETLWNPDFKDDGLVNLMEQISR
jgi:hypothetical protein